VTMPIDTDRFSAKLRTASVNLERREILLTDFRGSQQASDLSEPPNCGGVGRIRHFRRSRSDGWPLNPLPLDPAARALSLPPVELLRAQVFQNAACNWRCWYCYVDFPLLSANAARGQWLDAQTLVARYLAQPDPPPVIDLTGGQPDLVPEWILWMVDALENAGCADRPYLWSDDNLSTDYFWRYLSEIERERVVHYPRYGRVCCFKGFDQVSFAFNTGADPSLFARQFELFEPLFHAGLDLYAYATFTTPTPTGVNESVARFVDRLQSISERLPLRTVPLLVEVFSPVVGRLTGERRVALEHQWRAVEAWVRIMESRFSSMERARNIADVVL
jgi:uncharacterized Fe-S cluster-containing radical SAM superfamily protein